MKRRLFVKLAAFMIPVMILTGCGNKIPDLSDEEMDMVENYAAALLLKYDTNYKSGLLDKAGLEKELELKRQIEEEARRMAEREAARAAAEEAAKNESVSSNSSERARAETGDNAVDLESFLGLDGFSVSCNGVEFADSYADDGDELFFAITASPGCKVAISHIRVTNTTDEARDFDILNKNARFKLSFNGGAYHNTMVALLLTDFTMYAGNIGPHENVDLVMLVDLPEDECKDIYDLDLNIKYNGEGGRCSLIGDL